MASTWSLEGDGLASDREQAIAQAEDQFDLLRDGMIGDYPFDSHYREADAWTEALPKARRLEVRHD